MGRTINVKDYGAKGDVRTVFSRGSMDAGSDLLKLVGTVFNQFDNTKKISVSRLGGLNVNPLRTAIKRVWSNEEIILESKSFNAMGLMVTWGTDDTVALQSAVDIAEIGDTIVFPSGIYCIDKIRLRPGVTFTSQEGMAKSTITQILDNTTLFVDSAGTKPLKDVTFRGLIFVGSFDPDEINLQGEIIDLANIDGHTNIKFLDCEVRNFGKGVFVRLRTGHSMFEIRNCTFTKVVNPIYFLDTNTIDVKITDCKFTDCHDSIVVMNRVKESKYNTCDKVLIERCNFSGQMNYPIHFGNIAETVGGIEIRGIAATHVTVRGCVIHGADRWFHQKGSADQIALYDVEHFNVTGNTSKNGGDGGVIIERGKFGTISGNTCNENFGPGINISNDPKNTSNIHIDKNVCISNCRRLNLDVNDQLRSKRNFSPKGPAGGIMIYGKECLITNNHCSDPTSAATQEYGLSIHDDSTNITIGSDAVYPNLFNGPKGDIHMGLYPVEMLKSYDEYLKKIDQLKPY